MCDTTLNLDGSNKEQQAPWEKVTTGKVRNKIQLNIYIFLKIQRR